MWRGQRVQIVINHAVASRIRYQSRKCRTFGTKHTRRLIPTKFPSVEFYWSTPAVAAILSHTVSSDGLASRSFTDWDDDRPAAVDAGGMDQVCYQTVCITNLFIALWFYWPVSSTTVLAQLQISNCGKKHTYKLRLHCGPTVTMMSDCNWRTCLSKNAMLLLFKLIISKESWFFFF